MAMLTTGAAQAANKSVGAAAATSSEFDCLIEPSQTVEVRSPVPGVIERIFVERGQNVRRGAPLVGLESSVERAATELSRYKAQMDGAAQSAEARIQHDTRKVKRKSDLAERNYASTQDREDAEADLAIAQADALAARENKQLSKLEVAYASAQLAQRTIASPLDGVVVDIGMHAGELAQAGDSKPYIVKLAATNPLRVRLILPVSYYLKVKPGLRAAVTPEKPLDMAREATVTIVDKIIDAASGTFQIRMDLPNPNNSLPGGLKCRVALNGL